MSNPKVGFVSLGCPKALVDSERILTQLRVVAQLDRVGCFQYSPVDGAQANSLSNPVEEPVKQECQQRFMVKQQQISRHRLAQKIGRRLEVIIDKMKKHTWRGIHGRTLKAEKKGLTNQPKPLGK